MKVKRLQVKRALINKSKEVEQKTRIKNYVFVKKIIIGG